MSISLFLLIAAFILAVVAIAQSNGKGLISWAVVLLIVAVLLNIVPLHR